MVATAQPRLFLVHLLPMLVVAVAHHTLLEQVARAARAVVVQQTIQQDQELPIQAAVGPGHTLQAHQTLAPAAPASSS